MNTIINSAKRFALLIIALASVEVGSAQSFILNGSAEATDSECYTLTTAQEYQSGSMWSSETIDLTAPFHLNFTARFGNNPAGADGIVFAFQSVGQNTIGSDGGSLGYEGISPSFATEFDIYRNADLGDSNFDHVAVLRNGNISHQNADNLYGPLQAGLQPSIKDGEYHDIQIIWEPDENRFFVYFDCEQRVFMTIDLVSDIFDGNPNVRWGFTASTGGQSSELTVCIGSASAETASATYSACPGEPVQFEEIAPPSYSYQWTPAEFLDDPEATAPVATVEVTTLFTAQITDGCGHTFSGEVAIEINDTPGVDLGDDREICEGDSALFVLPEGFDYSWSGGQSGDSAYAFADGPFWVTAEYFGCLGNDTAIVTLTPGITALLTDIEPSLCGSATGSIDISSVNGGEAPYEYLLDGTPGGPVFENLAPGMYSVTASDSDGCGFTDTLTVQELPAGTPGFSADPTRGTVPLNVSLTDESNHEGNAFYAVGQTIYDINSQHIVFEEPGTFELLQVIWSGDFGCADTASVTIIAEEEVRVSIPNIVTPNGDGANDILVADLRGIASLRFQVFSRWGKLLFELPKTSVADGRKMIWDPREYNQGVYMYVISYRDVNGTEKQSEGTVTLVK